MVMNSTQSISSEKIDEGAVRSSSWLTAANMDILVKKLYFSKKIDAHENLILWEQVRMAFLSRKEVNFCSVLCLAHMKTC